MAEQDKSDKYIKCSKCRCKYINDEEHIKADLGYTRLQERYKTCVKCRTNRSDNYEKYKEHANEYSKQYKKRAQRRTISISS